MVRAIYAGVVAENLEHERTWYEAVFERPPDAAPMEGLYEWHLGESFLQLVSLAKVREIQKQPAWGTNGASSITFVVDDARATADRALRAGGKCISEFVNDAFRTISVADLEGNLVTLLQRS
jgi:hypothetical protein